MRTRILTIALAAAAFGALSGGAANAMSADRMIVPSPVEQTKFIFGGRNYCWYDAGWKGPGFYWCGYAFRRGLGWGGGAGFRGWNHGGGHIGRPGGGRPGHAIGRPGRPGGGHAGGRPGGGRPGGGGKGGHRR